MEPNRHEFDYDLPSHVITVGDWEHYLGDSFWPGYYQNKSHNIQRPDNYLINGRGSYKVGRGTRKYTRRHLKGTIISPSLTLQDSITRTKTPHSQFHVNSGYRYRFRIIGAVTSNCQFQIAFQGHSLTIISLDGYPVVPARGIQTLTMGAGQYNYICIQRIWIRLLEMWQPKK